MTMLLFCLVSFGCSAFSEVYPPVVQLGGGICVTSCSFREGMGYGIEGK